MDNVVAGEVLAIETLVVELVLPLLSAKGVVVIFSFSSFSFLSLWQSEVLWFFLLQCMQYLLLLQFPLLLLWFPSRPFSFLLAGFKLA